jgi:hypothetical protein
LIGAPLCIDQCLTGKCKSDLHVPTLDSLSDRGIDNRTTIKSLVPHSREPDTARPYVNGCSITVYRVPQSFRPRYSLSLRPVTDEITPYSGDPLDAHTIPYTVTHIRPLLPWNFALSLLFCFIFILDAHNDLLVSKFQDSFPHELSFLSPISTSFPSIRTVFLMIFRTFPHFFLSILLTSQSVVFPSESLPRYRYLCHQ